MRGSMRSPRRPTGSHWPKWISTCAGRAICLARSSTACRRCEWPICGETGQILEEARREAQQLFAADPGLKHPDHARLRRQMLVRYGNALDSATWGEHSICATIEPVGARA